MKKDDLYKLLGVARDATTEQITKAYRRLSLKHHPDRGGNPTKFHKIHHAYSVLTNETARCKYDETGDDSGVQIDNSFADTIDGVVEAISLAISMCPDVKQLDIISVAKKVLRDNLIGEHKKALAKLEKRLKELQQVANRIRPKDSTQENLLAKAIQAQVDRGNRGKKQSQQEIAKYEKAIEFLEQYQYMKDENQWCANGFRHFAFAMSFDGTIYKPAEPKPLPQGEQK